MYPTPVDYALAQARMEQLLAEAGYRPEHRPERPSTAWASPPYATGMAAAQRRSAGRRPPAPVAVARNWWAVLVQQVRFW